jgi:hypothetical protein
VGDNPRHHLMQGGEVRLELRTITTRTHVRILFQPADKIPTVKPPKPK